MGNPTKKEMSGGCFWMFPVCLLLIFIVGGLLHGFEKTANGMLNEALKLIVGVPVILIGLFIFWRWLDSGRK
jgi:hypothetical protein